MKTNANTTASHDLRPEHDLPELLKGAVRGKYAEQFRQGTNLVLLDPDVARAFPDAHAVNAALRLVMRLAKIPAASAGGRLGRER